MRPMEILTANEVVSGAAVYVDGAGRWQMDLQKARLFSDDAARDAVIAAAKATGRLVSIEIEKIEIVDGKIVPNRLRERIRAEGPTAPYGPKRQELGEDGHVSL